MANESDTTESKVQTIAEIIVVVISALERNLQLRRCFVCDRINSRKKQIAHFYCVFYEDYSQTLIRYIHKDSRSRHQHFSL